MRRIVVILGGAVLALAAVANIRAHCQVPCGIYDDATRFKLMSECVETIGKSVKEINRLSAEPKPDYNQLVRWVDNKDRQADDLAAIVSGYFMAQRIKPVDMSDAAARTKYVEQLTLAHQLLVQAMKSKQSANPAAAAQLRKLLDAFQDGYLGHPH